MKINHFVKFGIVSLLLLFLLPGTAEGQVLRGATLSTGFTYQGELKSGGTPYEGSCDFQIKLYDAGETGTLIVERRLCTRPDRDNTNDYWSVFITESVRYSITPWVSSAGIAPCTK